MSIKSYLAFPEPGRCENLLEKLADFPNLEFTPSNKGEVVVIVTDAKNEDEESALYDQLAALEDITCLSLAFAHQ